LAKTKIFMWGHPSPLSTYNQSDCAENFINCDVFGKCNEYLMGAGHADVTPINWNSVNGLPPVDTATIADVAVPSEPPEFSINSGLSGLSGLSDIPDVKLSAEPGPGLTLSHVVEQYNKIYTAVLANIALAQVGPCMNLRMMTPDDPVWISQGTLHVFTDGGATKNGKPDCKASWAYYITDGRATLAKADIVALGQGGEVPSNNRAELSAILFGLAATKSFAKINHIQVISDSKYSIKCQDWVKSWLGDLPKLQKKKNIDLICAVQELIVGLQVRVSFHHVHSHTDPPHPSTREWFMWKGNDIVDKMCTGIL